MRGYADHNFPAFAKATALLRSAGHEVFSPAEYDIAHGFDHQGVPDGCEDVPEFDLRKALAADLAWICAKADGVVVLPGWRASLGATAEAATALTLSLPVWELDVFLLYGADAAPVRGYTIADALTKQEVADAWPC
jgi:hypothetical protein